MTTPLRAYIYLILALWVASLGVPIPEDIWLLGGGFACYEYEGGAPDVGLMIAAGLFGVLSGDLFVFYLGRRWASSLLEHRMARRLTTPERLEALRRQFLRHQLKTVFVGRFLPGMRVLVFLTAGAMKMRAWKFLLVNGTAALISVPLFVALGYLFGHSYDQLKRRVQHAEHVIVFVAIVIACLWLLWHSYARSAREREARRLLSEDGPTDERGESGCAPNPPLESIRGAAPRRSESGGRGSAVK